MPFLMARNLTKDYLSTILSMEIKSVRLDPISNDTLNILTQVLP